MPQTDIGKPPPEKKNKKKRPTPTLPATDTSVGGNSFVPPAPAVHAALSDRAASLHPRLLTENPGMAAELLLGPTKSKQLANVSLAAYHAYQYRTALAAQQHEAATAFHAYETGQTALDSMSISPIVAVYTWRAKENLDPEAAAAFGQAAAVVTTMPLGPERDAAEQELIRYYDSLDTRSFASKLTSGVGHVIAAPITAPIWAVSKGVDIAGEHLPDVVAHPLDVAQEAVGDTLGAAGTAVQFATRNVEATLVNAEKAFTGQPTHLDYFTTWGEAEAGGHSPLTENLAGVLGTTADDPHLQGLFDVTDFGGDLIVQAGMFEALGAVKTSRTVPAGVGGSVDGATFVRSFGKKLVTDVTDYLSKPMDNVRARIIDRYKGANPSLADELASLGTKPTSAEVARVLEEHIDLVPTKELPRVQAELDAVRNELSAAEPTTPGTAPIPEGATRLISARRFGTAEATRTKGLEVSSKTSFGERPAVFGTKSLEGEAGRSITEGTIPAGEHVVEYYAYPKDIIPTSGVEGHPAVMTRNIPPEQIIRVYESALDPIRISELKAQEAALVSRATELQNFEPLWEFPKAARFRALMRGLGDTRTSRLLNHFFGEARAVDISKMADDIAAHDLQLIDPAALQKPPGWATHNVDILRKQMNVADVPKALQRTVIEDMFRVQKGELPTFDWRVSYSKALEEGITRGGRRVLTPEGQQAVRFSNQTVEARMHSPVEVSGVLEDGTRVTRLKNALEENGQPLPSQPNQLINTISVPNMDLLHNATSTLRYMDQWMRDKPYLGKAFGALKVPLDYAHFTVFTLPRAIVRPLLLAFRPNLGIKIQLDQAVRMTLSNMNPLKVWKLRNLDFDPATGIPIKVGLREILPEGDITFMGSVASEMVPATELVAYKLDTRGLDPTLRPKDARLVVDSRYDTLQSMAHDELMTHLARYGPEQTLPWTETRPWMEQIQRNIDRAGMTREQWIQAKEAELRQATGGDPAIREAIATSRWDAPAGKPVPTGAAKELADVREELSAARRQLSAEDGALGRQELNLRIEELENKAAWLEKHPQETTKVSLENDTAVKQRISDGWQDGSYKMPEEVVVRRSVHSGEYSTGTRLERARALAQHANRVAYGGMKWMSKMDELLTRGSTMKQVFDKVYHDLLEHGYAEADARVIASYRAAYITKDLHYDISARSSLDRKLKDYFWFSPVFREQLTTYLHKIPSKAYWGPGLLLEYGLAHTLVGGLKDMGFITDEVVNADGDTAPYFNIAGHQFSVGGLNPVTPGTSTLVPTISAGAEAILDMTAQHAPKELQPFFDAFASQFEFDQTTDEGPSFLPRTVMTAAELFGVHVPMDTLSLDAWKQAYNKAEIQSRRWAMSALAKQGIMPPTREALQTDEGYAREVADYEASVASEARRYELGLAFLHALGAVALPGSIRSETSTGVTAAGQAFYDFNDKVLSKLPYGSDEYYAAKDTYLRQHPAAWPYSVGTHAGEYGTPEYKNSYMTPDDYSQKALEQVGYWRRDEPAPEANPERNPDDFAALSPRRQARKTAEWTVSAVEDLTPLQASVVGLPEFDGRDKLLHEVGVIQRQYEKDYAYDMPEEQKALVAAHRDFLLKQAAFKYGENGQAVLNYLNATPGQRLNRSGYFHGPEVSLTLGDAATIKRHSRASIADIGIGSLAGASTTEYHGTSILEMKLDLYHKVDRLRAANPAFDRQMRYVELGMGDHDGPAGRVSTYEYLFFGVSENAFGYQSAIVEGLH